MTRAKITVMTVLLSLLLAGCTDSGDVAPEPASQRAGILPANVHEGLDLFDDLRQDRLVLDRPFTVNVVAVGWNMSLVDEDQVRDALPADTSPRIEFSRAGREGYRGSLLHEIEYDFHQAPEGFAADLFSIYPEVSEEVPLPGGDSGFLARYDALYGLGRTDAGTMRLVDVQRVEEHLQDLRVDHGLTFDGPHATVFLLDSWSQGHLPHDTFYWYSFNEDMRPDGDTQNLRAWGGTYDFLFLDRSAAPNDASTDESGLTKAYYVLGSQPVYAPEGTAYNDPPAWHYERDVATVGAGPYERRVTVTESVIAVLDPAVNIRILNDYIFRPVYPERFQVNVHLWHDGRSMVPTDRLHELIDAELLVNKLQEAIPWVPVDVVVKTYVAPQDDPGMDAALLKAKREGAGGSAAMPVLLNHVEANLDDYGANEPGVFDVMALAFVLEGHFAVVAPVVSGGAAITGADNQCWGTTTSANDVYYNQHGQDLETVRNYLTFISAHEINHCFGLPHGHDGTRRTADGYETALDHTWSSTNTTMSYRIATAGVDHFHRASIARAHVHDAVGQTVRALDWAYRALEADGRERVPAGLLGEMQEAMEGAEEALRLYDAGDDVAAAFAAVAAHQAAEDAFVAAGGTLDKNAAEQWDDQGVNHAGGKNSAFVFRPGVGVPEIMYDYRAVELGADAERVTVRASWTNSPTSWGDFFVGWRAPGILNPIFVNLSPADHMVTLATGIHDVDEEGPAYGAVVREFTLELDHFPALREDGVVFEAGVGSMGMAVNGAYEVEIEVERRDL